MKELFSEAGMQMLESLSLTKTLYGFDYDGTLSPIVDRPDDAHLSDSTKELLVKFARKVPTVIVSGRSIVDLKKRVKLPGVLLIGNHGLERPGVEKKSIVAAQRTSTSWANQLKASWHELKHPQGLKLEDKNYSLALHYRESRTKRQARSSLLALIAKLDPAPKVILGKCVMNLIPPGGPHKGIAVVEAMKKLGLSSIFYIGDDDTDEDVFSMPDHRITGVRVGKKKTSQARFFIHRQSEINRLIRTLLRLRFEADCDRSR